MEIFKSVGVQLWMETCLNMTQDTITRGFEGKIARK